MEVGQGPNWGCSAKEEEFLTSALDVGKWSVSRPCRFTPLGERAPGTHWIGGWVGPQSRSGRCAAHPYKTMVKLLLCIH
jgi:hypothetical protein